MKRVHYTLDGKALSDSIGDDTLSWACSVSESILRSLGGFERGARSCVFCNALVFFIMLDSSLGFLSINFKFENNVATYTGYRL